MIPWVRQPRPLPPSAAGCLNTTVAAGELVTAASIVLPPPAAGVVHLAEKGFFNSRYVGISVPDPDPPDPHVYGPHGSDPLVRDMDPNPDPNPTIILLSSANILRKILISTVLWLLSDILSFKNYVPSKSNKQKTKLCVPDPDSTGPVDPYPDPGGKKWPIKKRKKLRNFMLCFDELDILFWGLKASSLAWTSFTGA